MNGIQSGTEEPQDGSSNHIRFDPYLLNVISNDNTIPGSYNARSICFVWIVLDEGCRQALPTELLPQTKFIVFMQTTVQIARMLLRQRFPITDSKQAGRAGGESGNGHGSFEPTGRFQHSTSTRTEIPTARTTFSDVAQINFIVSPSFDYVACQILARELTTKTRTVSSEYERVNVASGFHVRSDRRILKHTTLFTFNSHARCSHLS